MLVVEVLVGGALIVVPLRVFFRDREWAGTPLTLLFCSFLTVSSWFLLNVIGLLIGAFAPSTVSSLVEVDSIKGDPYKAAVFVRTNEGIQIRSYKTENLTLQESEGEGVVAEIVFKLARSPAWWPRVLSFFLSPERQIGEPAITIRARKEKLEEILSKL